MAVQSKSVGGVIALVFLGINKVIILWGAMLR